MKCISCSASVGLLSRKFTYSGKGPFCRACLESRDLFVSTCAEHAGRMDKDAKSAAWVAVCHLVCTRYVNLAYVPEHVAGAAFPGKPTWEASREEAMDCARKALDLLAPGSIGEAFVSEVLRLAESVTAPVDPPVVSHLWTGIGMPEYPPAVWAIKSGEASMANLQETLRSIPGHEWLTEGIVGE